MRGPPIVNRKGRKTVAPAKARLVKQAQARGMTVARRPSVAIIGGGIGGLTAAASLRRAAFDVQVYEQARALSEIGAGINIGPNASRVLHRLGIAEELGRTGVKPVTFDQRRWDDGRVLLRSPLGRRSKALSAHLTTPFIVAICIAHWRMRSRRTRYISHTASHTWWITATASKRISKMVRRFQPTPSSERTEFIRLCATLCSVRKPRFTGCVAHRGMVPADRLTHLGLELRNQIWMGPSRHFVHYFVSAGTLVNFVAVTEEDSWLRESWVDRGDVADVLAAFQGWHNQVLSIIRAADEIYKWALFDRSPLPRWSVGRVTLLGDSCHPMLPFMGQGAAQAIEDAAALKGCISKLPSDVPTALRLYEQLRLTRASRLQGMSETNKTRFHLPDGQAQRKRDAEMASGATDWSWGAIAWLYQHDAEVVEDH